MFFFFNTPKDKFKNDFGHTVANYLARRGTVHAAVHAVTVESDDHVVRFLACRPLGSVYGLRAQEELPAHTPIGAYLGRLQEATKAVDGTGAYVFFLNQTDLPGYTGPALCIDASKWLGNETACCNDTFFLSDAQAAKVRNVAAHVLWDDDLKLPYIIFVTVRHVRIGEELLINYGPDFWLPICRKLSAQHMEYQITAAHALRNKECSGSCDGNLSPA